MSYPPGASRSCHEADGRSDRSGGSSGTGFHYYQQSSYGKWIDSVVTTATIAASHETVVTCYSMPSSTQKHITVIPKANTACVVTSDLRPNWTRWAQGLDNLLQDTEGTNLFKAYLQYEGCANLLDFWFACQGFRSKVDPSDDRKILQLIKAIYRTYIRFSSTSTGGSTNSSTTVCQYQPIRLRSETRRLISERISRKQGLDQTVFDPAQSEVEHFLRTTAYPAFLKSDVYVEFLQDAMKGNRKMINQPLHRQQQHFYHYQMPSPQLNWQNNSTIIGVQSSNNFNDFRFPSPTVFAPVSGSGTGNTVTPKTLPTVDEDRELRSEELVSVPNSTDTDPLPGLLHHQHPPPPPPSVFAGTGDFGRYTHEHHPTCACCPPSSYLLSGDSSAWVAPVVPHVEGGRYISPSAGVSPLTTANVHMAHPHHTEHPVRQHILHHRQEQQPGMHAYMPRPSTGIPHCQNRMMNAQAMAAGRPPDYYHYTHWADSVCPAAAAGGALASSPSTRAPQQSLLTQPPNPYHSSYAPVSAKDSERHSLSSGGARTDDARSHTDSSSHDGSSNKPHRLCHCTHQHRGQRYSHQLSQYATRLHHQSRRHHQEERQKPIPQVHRDVGDSMISATTLPAGVPAITSPPAEVSSTIMSNDSCGKRQNQRRSSVARRVTREDVCQLHSREAPVVQEQQSLTTNSSKPPATINKPVSSTRSHNLAERDPQAFFNLLSEKLQKVLDNQLATERLDRLMDSTTAATTNEASPSLLQTVATSSSNCCATGAEQSTLSTAVAAITGVITVSCASVGIMTTSTAVATTSGGSIHARLTSELPASSVLRRPWADRLLAAARVQHENTKEDAQAILEDHCSRIWAASADRTPTSSGSGDSPGGILENPTDASSSQQKTNSRAVLVSPDQVSDAIGEISVPRRSHHNHRRRYHGHRGTRRQQQQSEEPAIVLHPDHRKHRDKSIKDKGNYEDGLKHRGFTGYDLGEGERQEEEMSTAKLLTEFLPDPVYPCSIPSPPHGITVAFKQDHVAPGVKSSTIPMTEDSVKHPSNVRQSVIRPELQSSPHQSAVSPPLSSHSSSPLVAMTTAPPGLITTSDSAESTGGCLQSSSIQSHLPTNNSQSPGGVAVEVLGDLPKTAVTMVTGTTTTSNTSSSSMSGGAGFSGTPLVIGYYLGDDPVPYRSLWPGSEITLGQFKQLIPRKRGSFRYFFKKVSNEFDSGVVHQEVIYDDCVLPLWEGKVVAKVERID